MKRKLYDESPSIFVKPALESTALLDSGGITLKDSTTQTIGDITDFNINASLSSGTRLFQYNRFFWNNEINTFTYSSCGVGIVLSFFGGGTVQYTCIYPIFLPRCGMSLLQSLASQPETSPRDRLLLMKELVYFLNLGFTSYGGGLAKQNASWPSGVQPPAFSPVLYALNARGAIPVPFAAFPFFSDTSLPPLMWDIDSSNRHIILRTNPAFWSANPLYACGFNLISLEEFMLSSPSRVAWNTVTSTYVSSPILINGPLDQSAADNVWGVADRGWCVEGVFAEGFFKKANYGPQNSARQTYSDDYTSSERLALFNQTVLPVGGGTPITTDATGFKNFCSTYKLKYVAGGAAAFACVSAKFVCNLLPSRFIAIRSNAMTRNQKRPVVSNNPSFQGTSTIGIQFLSLDSRRTWIDYTLSGTGGGTSIVKSLIKNGIDDTPVVSMDPMQSILNLDIALEDEWGNTLQNYYPIHFQDPQTGGFIYGKLEGEYFVPASFPVPVAYQPLCPNPSSTNFESLVGNENWFAQSNYGSNYVFGSATRTKTLEESYLPQLPTSSTIIHFGRITGY